MGCATRYQATRLFLPFAYIIICNIYIYIYHHIWGFLSPKGYQKIAGWCHRTSKNHCWMTWGYPPDLDSSIWWMAWMDESTVSTAKFSEGVLWWCLGCHVATTITESIWKGNSIFWILCSEFQKRKGRLKKNTKKQSSGLSKHRGYSNTILMGAMFFSQQMRRKLGSLWNYPSAMFYNSLHWLYPLNYNYII